MGWDKIAQILEIGKNCFLDQTDYLNVKLSDETRVQARNDVIRLTVDCNLCDFLANVQ